MADELNLKLPERKPSSGLNRSVFVLLVCLLAVGAMNLLVSLYGARRGERPSSGAELPPEARKELALKLEKQGISDRATEAWKQYLSRADIGAEERAKVWYRIGKLYQGTGKHDQALDAYYRSESFAKIPELEPEINRRIQESLESLGKFAALRYELADRVGVVPTESSSGEEVLAEIGPLKITKSDIDRWIDEQIDRQMSTMAAYMSEEQRKSQREALLKHFSSKSERLRILNQLLVEEMLYRKAREDRLTEKPEVRAVLRDAERSILAQLVLEKELADQIKITPGDLQTYYEAHKQEFREKERQKTFEEARSEVYRALRSQKEAEVQEALMSELKEHYNVVIHTSRFPEETPGGSGTDAQKPSPGNDESK
jgi:tetratricopeptide (TPR) repeat protein